MNRSPEHSIIMAGGTGSRMQSSACHKVCFPVDGVPAINRGILSYNAAGVQRHTVVVGAMAGQVVETVGREFDNVQFVYQAEQLGTAHAARIGLQALPDPAGDDETVLLTPGDRIVDVSVLRKLFDTFYSGDNDLAFVALPRNRGSGRVVTADGNIPIAVVETADIYQRHVYRRIRELLSNKKETTCEALRKIIGETLGDGTGSIPRGKARSALGPLWEAVMEQDRTPDVKELVSWIPESMTEFHFHGRDGNLLTVTPDEADNAQWVNVSIYVARVAALRHVLPLLTRDNAQEEEYLTDSVQLLTTNSDRSRPGQITMCVVADPSLVLGYNDPADLLEVEAIVQARKRRSEEPGPGARWCRPIASWRKSFDAVLRKDDPAEDPFLNGLLTKYGSDRTVLSARCDAFVSLLTLAGKILGNEESVFLVHSPGRVNVMGRHVDHQGGHCNLMTIGFETLMVIRMRDDDRVRLFNIDNARYPERCFEIEQLVRDLPWDDWLSLVNSSKVVDMSRQYGGDWSQYVKAAVLRLQKKFKDRCLKGMDIVVSGNIPPAAGLSSSSSLVVGAMEATIAGNNLEVSPAQIVDLCGEGEWFVGTRGGSADHAAIRLGQKGRVIKVTFFDFAVEDSVPFPKEHVMAVCDSGTRAQKSADAKDQFNHRIGCYRIGMELIRKEFPQYEHLMRHLRDVNVRTLGVPPAWIYRMLLKLPCGTTRRELHNILPPEVLKPILASHTVPDDYGYPIRGVVLYGLSEFERARLYAARLKEEKFMEIGHMMNVSHDGDRVSRLAEDGSVVTFSAPVSDEHIRSLIEDLKSGDPERVQRAQLEEQPGAYACSTADIDRMVDTALQVEGVEGAQLAGAGLGGCMMALLHRDAVAKLREKLVQQYYRPMDREPTILVCRPVEGAGVVMMDA